MMSAHALRISLILAPLTLLLGPSCSDDEPEPPTASAALLACGLMTDGQLGGLGDPQGPYETCAAQCVASNSCEILEALVCGGDDVANQALIDGCYTQCLQAHGHACGGQLFPPKYVCDGYNDCMDESDEAMCPADFVCDDGEPLAPAYRCNEALDCEDGSDEVDCPTPTTFACASGELIPASSVCNFFMNCKDGSDEASELGCAQPTCPG